MTTGITSTQSIKAPPVDVCCNRQGPHVHYVPRKPPVNAAGDVDVFDGSNQPSMDIGEGTMSPGVTHDRTVHEEIEIPDFVAEEEEAEVIVEETEETETTEEEEDAEVQE